MPRRKREFEDLIARLTPVVWPALREEYAPDCCIAATRILKGVFEHYGYTSQGVPCNVYVFNPKCHELMQKGLVPEDPQERLALYEKTGAWGLGITRDSERLGREIPGGRFGGHLVLKVRQVLIDATLKQADRPDKQIVLPDFAVMRNVPGGFWTDKNFTVFVDNGCTVTYEHNHNYSYRAAPDWMRGAEFAPYLETVNKIIARVEAQEPGRAAEFEDAHAQQ